MGDSNVVENAIFVAFVKPHSKCGGTDFGYWTSSKTRKLCQYCRVCRNSRARAYAARKVRNGGHHTRAQFLKKLRSYVRCPGCDTPWDEVAERPDPRYHRYKWTEDHIVPLLCGGSDDIENIQPLCWICNFKKIAKLNWHAEVDNSVVSKIVPNI
jgi:ribosomal protein L34E